MSHRQTAQIVTAGGSDLSACDREPIRIPGSIQPHGLLLVLARDDLQILQASENAGSILAGELADAIGRRLPDVLADPQDELIHALSTALPAQGNGYLTRIEILDQCFDAVAHRVGDTILLELEHARSEDRGSLDLLYPRIRTFVDELQAQPDQEAATALAAAQIREITGFDRVLIYRFEDDWTGIVVAEDRNETLPSYMDLRFPASDIPAQARELYRLNRLRIIPDATYEPVPIRPLDNPRTGRPLDLSQAVLRSVSPVHVEYMRAMGTPASMSISIVESGRLWGLVSCHHAVPRRLPIHIRTACDFLGQILAMQISANARRADAEGRAAKQEIQARLLAYMAGEEQFIRGLIKNPVDLLGLTGAAGAAVVSGEDCDLIGLTPPAEDVRRIVDWLDTEHAGETVYQTTSLASEMKAPGLSDVASGLLAISISQVHSSYLLWFRPEVVQTVKWGGDPRKPAAESASGDRISPRRSFEAWKETVSATSLNWSQTEIDAASSLRAAITGIVMRKAEELAMLNKELTRSNKELEAFSYSVSHDLRAPFRHIVGFAEMLKETDSIREDRTSLRYVDTIIESALSAGTLVDDLLAYSQMGRTTLVPIRVDMQRLVEEVRRLLRPDQEGREIEWIVGDLPPAMGDPGMLRQVIQNLISNALKYTRARDRAVVEITAQERPGETVYTVRDNGVGFEMAYVGKLFGVFQRLHRMEEFEGTGIGLANVRRIIERHGGRVWAEGRVDEGASFSFALPWKSEE